MTDPVPTYTLAKILGFYFAAVGIGVFLAPQRWLDLMDEFKSSKALIFLAGIIAFVIGVAMVLIHRDWSTALATVITVVGYVAALKGLLLIAWPQFPLSMIDIMKNKTILRGWSLLILAAGGLLIYFGYSG